MTKIYFLPPVRRRPSGDRSRVVRFLRRWAHDDAPGDATFQSLEVALEEGETRRALWIPRELAGSAWYRVLSTVSLRHVAIVMFVLSIVNLTISLWSGVLTPVLLLAIAAGPLMICAYTALSRPHESRPLLNGSEESWNEGDDLWMVTFRRRMLEHAKNRLDPVDRFSSEVEIYDALTRLMGTLRQGDCVHAVCGIKQWDSAALRCYMDANTKAVRNGVRISRIFVDSQPEAKLEALRQKDAGITVKMISLERFGELAAQWYLPPRMGFVTLKDHQAFIHWGSGARARGYLLKSPIVVAEMRDLFRSVKARSYDVEISNVDQDAELPGGVHVAAAHG